MASFSLANLITYITELLVGTGSGDSHVDGVLDWVGDVITAALAQPLVVFFIALGICGIMFRYAKGLLSIR